MPSRVAALARSRRSASSRRTRPSLRVRRASMPLRIHASSCAQNWSNLRCADRFGGELVGLARLVGGEVAGIRAQQAAIELDDARGDAIEERAVVRDDDRGRAPCATQLLDQRDAVDVEMVGGLVEQQQVGRQRERQRERRALASRRRRPLGRGRLVEAEAMQELDQPRLGAPAVALVGNRVEPAAQREALAQRRRARQLGLLLDQHDARGRRASSARRRRARAARRSPASSDDLPVPLRPMRPMRSPSPHGRGSRGRAADAGRRRARRPAG